MQFLLKSVQKTDYSLYLINEIKSDFSFFYHCLIFFSLILSFWPTHDGFLSFENLLPKNISR